MLHLFSPVKTLLRDRSGLSAIEYGILASLVALAAVQAIGGLGTEVSNSMDQTSGQLANQQPVIPQSNQNRQGSQSTVNPLEPAFSDPLPPQNGGADEPAPAMMAPEI